MGDLEYEIIHAFALIAGLATSTRTTSLAPGQLVAFNKFLVAGVNNGALAAGTMAEYRLLDILIGYSDFLTVFYVGDGTFADRIGHRLLDMLAITAQKALAVYRAFIFAVEASINQVAQNPYLRLLRFTDPQIPFGQ